MDKHGAASVLSAFEGILNQNLPINVTASMALFKIL
jgi:leucyl aminopeptidase